MNKVFRLIYGIVGILVTLIHLVLYLYLGYYWLYFILGFGLIYLVFVLPLN